MKQLTFSGSWESRIQAENLSLSVVVNLPFGPHTVEPHLAITLHTHVYYELFACVKGSITISTDDRVLQLNAGDIALVPIGVRHYLNENIVPAEYEVIGFSCTPLGSIPYTGLYKALYPLLKSPGIVVYRNLPTQLTQIQMITRRHESHAVPDCYPALQMLLILTELASLPPEQDESMPAEQPLPTSRTDDIQRINTLEQLIAHNYMQPIRIDDFADELHIGIRQLARIVEKHYGKSLHRIIMDKRLETAENLLLHSDLTVEKIGVSVGFNSKASFYREFSRKHQMTPTQYREAAYTVTQSD